LAEAVHGGLPRFIVAGLDVEQVDDDCREKDSDPGGWEVLFETSSVQILGYAGDFSGSFADLLS
jgi:hypothetical protein